MGHQDNLARKALEDEDKALVAVGTPTLDRIQDYFQGARGPRRFDRFGHSNDNTTDYYNPAFNPQNMRTRAMVSVEAVAFQEIAQNAKMIYVPCGISSGLRAHESLDRLNKSSQSKYDTTHEAGHKLGSPTHGKIMLQNRDDTMLRGAYVIASHPDSLVILPPIREGAVRALSDQAFAQGQRYEEEDFMAFWYPAIDRCTGMMIDITQSGGLDYDETHNDWNFSRNSIWEMMRGLLIQAGEHPDRPQADMEVFDIENRPVTLLQRAWKMTEMLNYQLGKGFDTREAATALAQMFTIDDDIRAGRIPQNGSALHPILKHRTPEELQAMDALKAHYKPLLLAHCASHMWLKDLPAEYHEAAKKKPKPLTKAQRKYFTEFADKVSARANEILSVDPSGKTRAEHANREYRNLLRYDSHEEFFEKRAGSMIFEDDLYHKLSHWERLALPFVHGASEIGIYPANQPMATAIFTDLKRGTIGFERAQAAGIASMNELAGALGSAIDPVIQQNLQAAEHLKAALKEEAPGRIVVNTPSFLRIAGAIERFRNVSEKNQRLVAVDGPSATSPLMRLAMQMKYLDRNVNRAVFQEGWQYSNDLVQLRVRARLIQAGLVPRPDNVPQKLTITDMGSPEKIPTLLDDMKLLTAEVKRNAEAGVRAPEPALALARLVALHEIMVDPTLEHTEHRTTRQLVNRLEADPSLMANRQQAMQVAAEAKELLMTKALFLRSTAGNRVGDELLIPRERLVAPPDPTDDGDRAAAKIVQNRLMQQYIVAQDQLIGKQALAKERTRTSEIHVKRDGMLR